MVNEEYRNSDTSQETVPEEQTACEQGTKECCGACGSEESAEPEVPETESETEQADDAAVDEEEQTSEPEGKKGFFSRNKKAEKEKAELKDKVEALEDKVRRQMAEFDNFRKRTDKEKDQMFSMGEKNVIEKILPIVDNFERGFDTVDEADKEDAFVSGMEKVYTQLVKQLEALGVTPIEAVGKEFNPDLHNAVMQVESEEFESGIVAQELQKGYMYRDQVLRHSMVAVAQ